MEGVAPPPPPPAVKPVLRRSRLQWLFVWRTPGFKALKANLAKHMQKVEEAKEVRFDTEGRGLDVGCPVTPAVCFLL